MIDIFLDWETRSRCDLRKAGADVYARDPSTEVLCLAYAIGDAEPQLWVPGDERPDELLKLVERGATLHAHNAAFEIAIWTHVMSRHWPVPRLSQWRCTMAAASHAGLPRSLDMASRALGLSHEKDKEGHRIMLKHCKPRKVTKNNPSEWHEDAAEREKLYAYCKQDVVVEREIDRVIPPLPEDEQALWLLDQRINQRGVPIDRELCGSAIEMYEEYRRVLLDELRVITDGQVTTAGQVERMVKWCAGRGTNIDNMTAPTVEQLLARDDLEPNTRRLVEIRRDLSLASIKKYDAMLRWSEADGRARGVHQFMGAERTGRWAGRGIQTQNIKRGGLRKEEIDAAADVVLAGDVDAVETLFGDVPTTLSSLIRSAICAKDGQLVVCDFAAIEARVLAWLAGQEDVLQQFRDGQDVYKHLAGKVYAIDPDDVTKPQRFVGKVAVLGLGYGMGHKKFRETCAKYGQALDEPFCRKVVEVYREANSEIKRFWYALNDACVEVVKAHAEGARCSRSVERLRVDWHDRWLRIKLPSGRYLHYIDPEVENAETPWGDMKPQVSYMGLDSYTNAWTRLRSYGGKWAENVTQAVARDLLAAAMHRVDDHGVRTVMHVHDEIVCETNLSVEDVEQLMCIVPTWAEGCPIDAEGFKATRYRK